MVKSVVIPNDSEKTVDAFEDGNHHLILVLGRRLIFGVSARVDDPVHVEVQIVELYLVRIRLCRVHRRADTVHLWGLH